MSDFDKYLDSIEHNKELPDGVLIQPLSLEYIIRTVLISTCNVNKSLFDLASDPQKWASVISKSEKEHGIVYPNKELRLIENIIDDTHDLLQMGMQRSDELFEESSESPDLKLAQLAVYVTKLIYEQGDRHDPGPEPYELTLPIIVDFLYNNWNTFEDGTQALDSVLGLLDKHVLLGFDMILATIRLKLEIYHNLKRQSPNRFTNAKYGDTEFEFAY